MPQAPGISLLDDPAYEPTVISIPPGSSTSFDAPPSSESSSPPDDDVDWPPKGPVDQLFPPSQHSYSLLDSVSDCQELELRTVDWAEAAGQIKQNHDAFTLPLYRAAALACLGRFAEAGIEDRMLLQRIDNDFKHERSQRKAGPLLLVHRGIFLAQLVQDGAVRFLELSDVRNRGPVLGHATLDDFAQRG